MAKETSDLLDLDRTNFKGRVLFLTLLSTALSVGQFSNVSVKSSSGLHVSASHGFFHLSSCLLLPQGGPPVKAKVELPLVQGEGGTHHTRYGSAAGTRRQA